MSVYTDETCRKAVCGERGVGRYAAGFGAPGVKQDTLGGTPERVQGEDMEAASKAPVLQR